MASVFTREEVAKHCTPEDAWIIVDGDVYDITKFAGLHPGGKQTLLDYAGKDGTEDFYGLHRQEVLDKYKRLKKGRVKDAGPPRKSFTETFSEMSKVPFGDASYLQGFHSPYIKESHRKLRAALRKFYAEEVLEDALECEATGKAPSKALRVRTGDVGIVAMVQGPGEHLRYAPNGIFGGLVKIEEFDFFHEMAVHEERCRFMAPGFEDGLDGGSVFSTPVIIKYGSEEMKKRVLPPLFSGEQCAALVITEAYAGSDVAGLRTQGVLDPTGQFYTVNGTKKWITGGMYADYFVTAVRTGKAGAGGISMMLIPRSDQITTTQMKTKYSSAAGTAFVAIEGAKVPKANLFGKENSGFGIIMSNFNHERWMITVCCISRARLCTEEVFKWSMQRKVFGKPLIEQPVIREKLAQMFAALEACTALCCEVTYNMNIMGAASAAMGARIALGKYHTTRMMHLVADNAVQVLGGRGVTLGGMGRVVETFHRFYKVPSVYGGSEEIMADLSVRQAIKAYPPTARL